MAAFPGFAMFVATLSRLRPRVGGVRHARPATCRVPPRYLRCEHTSFEGRLMLKRLLLGVAFLVTPFVGCASSDEPPPGHKVVGRFVKSASADAPIDSQGAQL